MLRKNRRRENSRMEDRASMAHVITGTSRWSCFVLINTQVGLGVGETMGVCVLCQCEDSEIDTLVQTDSCLDLFLVNILFEQPHGRPLSCGWSVTCTCKVSAQ